MHKRIRNSIILFLMCVFILSIFYISHSKLKVGIIGVDNISKDYLNISKSGFETYYPNYFEPLIIDEKFSSKNIRINDTFYLNSDFFLEAQRNNIHKKYNLDYLLIITDYPIKDWDEQGFGLWGQADTKTNSALITIAYFKNNNLTIQNHGNHEVLHLLGYMHNVFDKSGIMQYVNNDKTNLCTYYNFQMPFRTTIGKLLKSQNFMFTVYTMNFLFSSILFLGFLGINEILYYYDEKKFNNNKRSLQIDILSSILFFIFAIFYNYIFFIFTLPLLFLIGMHLLRHEQQKSDKTKLSIKK